MALRTARGVFGMLRAGMGEARTCLLSGRDDGTVIESMEELCDRVRRLRVLSRRFFETDVVEARDPGHQNGESRKTR